MNEEKLSLIMSIYGMDWREPTKEELHAGDEYLKKFFEEEKIDPKSNFGIAISNLANDYMSENLYYGFRNGFIMGVRLMVEVFACE